MRSKTPLLSLNAVQQSHIEKFHEEFDNSGDIFDMANYIAAMEKYLNHAKANLYPRDCIKCNIKGHIEQQGYLDAALKDWPLGDKPLITKIS